MTYSNLAVDYYRRSAINVLTFMIDPLDHYTEIKSGDLVAATGELPTWFTYAPGDETLLETMERCYVWGLNELDGAVVDPGTGVMIYPNDPDMYPLMMWEKDEQKCYAYEHGYVAFVEGSQVLLVVRAD